MAEHLLSKFENIEQLMNATITPLSNVAGFAQTRAEAVHDYFKNLENRTMLSELQAENINFTYHKRLKNIYSPLTGNKLAFTGKLSKSRSYYVKILKQHNAVVANTITKNVNYLVLGENPGSKLAAAQQLKNIKIITEAELLKLLKP